MTKRAQSLASGRAVRILGHGLGSLPGGALGEVRAQRSVRRVDGSQRVVGTLENLGEQQVAEVRVVEFCPGARRGDVGVRAAAERVGRDRRLRAVVLTPVDENFPRARSSRHLTDDEVGMVGLDRARELPRDGAGRVAGLSSVEARVEVDPFASAGDREGVEPDVLEDRSGPPRHLGALDETDPGPRIEVEHETVGVLPFAVAREAPLRHVQLQTRDLCEVDEGGQVVDEGVVLRARGMIDREAAHPGRSARLESLGEERFARAGIRSHSVGPAFAGHRAVGDVREQQGSDPRVVVDHLALGGAGLGVEHLVEVRQTQAATADAHRLLRHRPSVERGRWRVPRGLRARGAGFRWTGASPG